MPSRTIFDIMRDLQIVTEVCIHVQTHGRVAQSVEQRIENPRVGSSILPPATSIDKGLVFN
jgi:hypothetical protein